MEDLEYEREGESGRLDEVRDLCSRVRNYIGSAERDAGTTPRFNLEDEATRSRAPPSVRQRETTSGSNPFDDLGTPLGEPLGACAAPAQMQGNPQTL